MSSLSDVAWDGPGVVCNGPCVVCDCPDAVCVGLTQTFAQKMSDSRKYVTYCEDADDLLSKYVMPYERLGVV